MPSTKKSKATTNPTLKGVKISATVSTDLEIEVVLLRDGKLFEFNTIDDAMDFFQNIDDALFVKGSI